MNAVTEFVSELSTPVGFLRIVASANAVTEIRFYDEPLAQSMLQSNDISELAKTQLKAYIAGELRVFDLPLAAQGTHFQHRVWRQLLQVDYAKTASYLDIAKALNKPTACRAVGAANGKNPISIVIPCHRVIGASGKLTGYAGGLSRKAFLLALEAQKKA